MANVLVENLDYTYNGKESTDLFFKPSVSSPQFSMFRIMDDVQSKKQLNLVGNLRNIVQKYDTCDRPDPSSGIDITNRTLEVTELEVFLEQCKDTFEDSIFETALRDGIERNDVTGTIIEKAILTLVTDAMRRDNFDIFSFGDTNATGPADFLNKLDGLWTRLIDGTSDYCVKRIGAGFGSGNLAADAALNRLRLMYSQAPNILKESPDKKFFVTQSIFDNLLTSYESVTSGSNLQFQLLQDGTQVLKFRGIEVVPILAWDDAIERYGLDAPHRILYTVADNHVIGLNRAGDFEKVGVWYERKDRKVYFEAQYRMGYNYVHCDLQAIAY